MQVNWGSACVRKKCVWVGGWGGGGRGGIGETRGRKG